MKNIISVLSSAIPSILFLGLALFMGLGFLFGWAIPILIYFFIALFFSRMAVDYAEKKFQGDEEGSKKEDKKIKLSLLIIGLILFILPFIAAAVNGNGGDAGMLVFVLLVSAVFFLIFILIFNIWIPEAFFEKYLIKKNINKIN